MGGQVLGGGVIALVAVLLWLVYLLPSWHSRHQFNAAERNAVRLNQALRILAETSETPDAVRLELTARTALRQQKLARRAAAEREEAGLEQARADLESARAERAAARNRPEARRARARRRARLVASILGVAALGLAGWGGWEVVQTGSQVALWSGAGVAVACVLVLRRMARVSARTGARVAASVDVVVAEARSSGVTELMDDRSWTPRSLPQPLSASAGSRAAVALDAADAQRALREAARDEALRRRAERLRPAPPEIAAARAARETVSAPSFASMGHVDDAEIEAHVRDLLARRAAG